jgi:hypothetical protein
MLKQHTEMTKRCWEGKKRVMEEVMAGRIGLLEAAAEFRDLHAPLEDGYDPVFGTYRPLHDEEVCQNVLELVRSRLGGAKRTPVLSRLEKEYREEFREEPPAAWPPFSAL